MIITDSDNVTVIKQKLDLQIALAIFVRNL